MITSRQIEAFRAVMVTGTITQAASMLFVSQPAVSRLISDLEREIEFKLFVRAKRQLIPTEEARSLFEEVERAFIGVQQIARAAEAILEHRRGHFRLITIPSLASNFATQVVSEFVRRYPSITVSIEVQPSQRLVRWIASQQYDLGLSTLPANNAAVDMQPVCKGNLVCILPADHRLAAKKKIRPHDLEDENFISYRIDSYSRHIVDEVFRKARVRRVLNIDARTTEAIRGLVAAGLGVSIIEPMFHGTEDQQGLVIRPFEPAIPVELSVFIPASMPLSRIAKQFLEIVTEVARPSN